MPLIGNPYVIGDTTGNFKKLDDLSSYTLTFNPSSDVSTTNDTITETDHRFITGQRVTYTHGGGTAIGGLTSGSAYYVVKNDASTIKLAATYADALISNTINLSSAGSGTSHTINLAFDGINTRFKATYNDGTAAKITNAAQLTISVNGVLQQPFETATPSSGYGIDHPGIIVFSVAPTGSDIFWGNVIANNFPTYDITDNKVDNFTGNGSQTEFTLSRTVPNNESLLVTVDGVTQYPSDNQSNRAYTVYDSILTFSEAPGSGAVIQARHIGFAGAVTSAVTGFYGRTGNVGLSTIDNINIGSIASVGNINSAGIITASKVRIGSSTTFSEDLVVQGNARVTGIFSIGTSSIEIDGDNNTINVGAGVTIHTTTTTFNQLQVSGVSTFIGISTFLNNVYAPNGIQGIGIYSGGTPVYTGILTALNFIGTGNTFAIRGTTVDISIQGGGGSGGGGGGTGVSSTGILTCRGIANSSVIMDSLTLDDYYVQGTNYAMIGPIEVSVGATITVGAGVSYVVI